MKKLLFIAIFICSVAYPVFPGDLTILTEDLPPLNFVQDGVLTGPAVDIVREIQRRVGSQEEIKVYPWARAFQLALEETNVILFSMARTEVRRDKFKWIGPIAYKRDILVARKGAGLMITSLEDAKAVDHIGTLRNDAKEVFLKRHNFNNLVPTHDDRRNAKKLVLGRIDLWATKIPGFKTTCNLAGVDYHDIEEVYSMRRSDIWIAASKQTSDTLVQSWELAFQGMRQDGTMLKIQKKWNKLLDDAPFPEIE